MRTGYKVDWILAECLGKETRTSARKITEAIPITIFGEQVMTIT